MEIVKKELNKINKKILIVVHTKLLIFHYTVDQIKIIKCCYILDTKL